jgi:hypothetical protein
VSAPLITAAGAYLDIASEDYHRHPNLLPGPSISSSGLKTLLTRSPSHYWYDSPLNPDRPPEKDKAHFRVGKAAHDVVLLGARWATHYHVTPEGFSRAKTKAMADEIAAVEAAEAAGLTILSHEQADQVQAMAASLAANKLARAVLSHGEPEVTLAWQDAETGVWLRARPDFLPHKRQIIPDLKTAADGSPKGFQRAIASCGYSQSAALYLDGIEAIYGERPTNWLHVVIEKEAPYVVSLYELPAEDIGRGRWLNRKAIRLYAECLNSGTWPGYADAPTMLGLPGWDRRQIDEGHTPEEAAWGFSQAA